MANMAPSSPSLLLKNSINSTTTILLLIVILSSCVSSCVSFCIGNKATKNAASSKTSNSNNNDGLSSARSFIEEAQRYVKEKKSEDAFSSLMEAYAIDPNANGIQKGFESCLKLRIDLAVEQQQEEEEEASESNDNTVIIVEKMGLLEDRFGLAALLIDQERHEEASFQLRTIVSSLSESLSNKNNNKNNKNNKNSNNNDDKTQRQRDMLDKASSMLYRTSMSACQWTNIEKDSAALVSSLQRSRTSGKAVPPLHPFDALKWSCVSLEDATEVARRYSIRANLFSLNTNNAELPIDFMKDNDDAASVSNPIRVSRTTHSSSSNHRKIRIGYISPDFTGKHPLAFLMQNVFALHDRTKFTTHVYSLSKDDGSPEVNSIKDGADQWIDLSHLSNSAHQLASTIRNDNLDLVIDLCGHAGTMIVSECMARRVAPIQISYMGFPGSSGVSSNGGIDYLLCDEIVVPYFEQDIRRSYKENLILMPHCYFVNSHASIQSMEDHVLAYDERERYHLPKDAFVFCCHSRPDKIDPITFRVWMSALSSSLSSNNPPKVLLWLLRSGNEMETNLRRIAKHEYGLDDARVLVFADIAPREEHLARLALADVFLDTPAYNAHTLGCDALFAGLPMISLLRPLHNHHPPHLDQHQKQGGGGDGGKLQTQKLASRVGASLLKAAYLEEMIVPDMKSYQALMIKCVEDTTWMQSMKDRLRRNRNSCPLFDTQRWVANMELALMEIVFGNHMNDGLRDILVVDDDDDEDGGGKP